MALDIPAALAGIQSRNVELLTSVFGGSTRSANAPAGTGFLDVLNAVSGAGTSAPPVAALTGTQGAGGFAALNNLGSMFGDGMLQLFVAFNQRQTMYSTEQGRLQSMQEKLAGLSETARSLQQFTADSNAADIKAALQDFVNLYNAWDSEFDADVASGGVLHENQAATMARFSMQRAVTDFFNGRGNGGLGSGMSELGITLRPDGQLAFDTAQFDAAMASDKVAAVKTVANMANGLSRDADSLLQPGSVLSNRLGRLADALAFIGQNMPAFAAAPQEKPTGQAAAMAMYQSMQGL